MTRSTPPRVLFIHNGSPGRFTPLARALLARGWAGALINGPAGAAIAGLETRRYRAGLPEQRSSYRPVRGVEDAFLAGRGAAQEAERLRAEGFVPDLIIGHPGWGEMLFLAEVFPGVPQIQLGEFYYRSDGADANFDPEFPARRLDSRITVATQNTALALSHVHAAAIVAPTLFQASLIPDCFGERLHVIHEGIPTERIGPPADGAAEEPVILADGTVLDGGTPWISFASRRFEPLRGVHVFMRMLPQLFALVPDLRVVMVGADEADIYGLPPQGGGTWLATMLAELGDRLDRSRLHVVPPVPHAVLHRIMAGAMAHVYLTYPFVLSWSLLEAMACEALVIASDTAPVRDAVAHGQNGLLVDFFDQAAMAAQIAAVCADPARFAPLRRAARQSVVDGFDRTRLCEPAWLRLIGEVSGIALPG